MEISGNAFSAGLSGIQAGQRRVDQAASDIANAGVAPQQPMENASAARDPADNPVDLADSLVSLSQGRNEVQASARVVETADEVLGTLIDTRA